MASESARFCHLKIVLCSQFTSKLVGYWIKVVLWGNENPRRIFMAAEISEYFSGHEAWTT
jgi:hypothetical protein